MMNFEPSLSPVNSHQLNSQTPPTPAMSPQITHPSGASPWCRTEQPHVPDSTPSDHNTEHKPDHRHEDEQKPQVNKNQRYCIYCQSHKVWKFRGDKARDGSKIYIDEGGSRWAGKRCPQCEKKRVRAANKHDNFERASIVHKLQSQGYKVMSTASPMLVQKSGEYLTVGIQRAFTDPEGNIIVEQPTEASSKTHLTALLFQTTKLVTHEQLQALDDKLQRYPAKASSSRIAPQREASPGFINPSHNGTHHQPNQAGRAC